MDKHLDISKECVIQKITMVLVFLFVVAGTGELGPSRTPAPDSMFCVRLPTIG